MLGPTIAIAMPPKPPMDADAGWMAWWVSLSGSTFTQLSGDIRQAKLVEEPVAGGKKSYRSFLTKNRFQWLIASLRQLGKLEGYSEIC
ncbi:hypothetical protein [Oscillatoria sp. HE19RPO]|uniref:hypothetical protein n=1 Tax=Oscillatoria sp. HE19RPO TaxID=2954806 RepID=UPI0020C38D75|nr:hypothetical protein [Oscillatoria sp. HE19RPO]